MTPPFLRALAFTLAPDVEGGLADDPRDSGGRTNHGITQGAYDAWRVTTGQGKRPVDDITDYEIKAIYFSDYWMPIKGDSLPEPLSHAVFDMAVNSNPNNAARTLQRAVGAFVDGIVGDETIRAAKAMPNGVFKFLNERGRFIQKVIEAHPEKVYALGHWIYRLLKMQQAAR